MRLLFRTTNETIYSTSESYLSWWSRILCELLFHNFFNFLSTMGNRINLVGHLRRDDDNSILISNDGIARPETFLLANSMRMMVESLGSIGR